MLQWLYLTSEQRQRYNAVKKGFNTYFVPKIYIKFERAKFNKRVHRLTETVDSCITVLYTLAENCVYRDLQDKLLRDRLVVDLTLMKAIKMARQSVEIKRQQTDLRGEM